MRSARGFVLLALVGAGARAQTSISACEPFTDSTAAQQVKTFGNLRVCMIATKVVGTDAVKPVDWVSKGDLVVLETQRPNDRRQAVVGFTQWTVNGSAAPQDSMTRKWQKAVVELLDASFESDELRRQSEDLRTQIDSLPGRTQATKERIAFYELKDRQLNQQITLAVDEEPSARTELSRLEAQRAAADNRVNSAYRQAASATTDQQRSMYEGQARTAEAESFRLSQAILATNRRITSDIPRRIAAAREELRALQPKHNIALLYLQLSNYESTKIEDLERQITQLDAPRRLPALDARVETARRALLAVLDGRGKAPSR